jgi:membrane protease YdiL (CAAX protease family)
MLSGFGHPHELMPGFFNLSLAGAVLALAYQWTGNLYFSVGLHAGWIFWLKSYGTLTRVVPGANGWLWGGDKMINGWVVLPVLACALVVVTRVRSGPGYKSALGGAGLGLSEPVSGPAVKH